MKSTNSLINKLLDILYNLKTSGNPHPYFLEATKLNAKNYKLSELFILIRRPFSGKKPKRRETYDDIKKSKYVLQVIIMSFGQILIYKNKNPSLAPICHIVNPL